MEKQKWLLFYLKSQPQKYFLTTKSASDIIWQKNNFESQKLFKEKYVLALSGFSVKILPIF